MLASGGDPYPAISINEGRISSLRRDGGKLERIQIDATTNPGNSGGPLVGTDGRVLGIIVSTIRGTNVNFAIPADKLLAMIRQPVLSLTVPETLYRDRGVARDFEIEIIPTAAGPLTPGAKLTLWLGEPAGPRRSFPAEQTGTKYHVRAAPLDLGAKPIPQRLLLETAFPFLTVYSPIDDVPVQIGDRKLLLSEIHTGTGQGGRFEVALARVDDESGRPEKLSGKMTGLPILHSELNHLEVDLQSTSRFKVSAYDPGLVKVPWELVLTAGGKTIASSAGLIPLIDPPASVESYFTNNEFDGFPGRNPGRFHERRSPGQMG